MLSSRWQPWRGAGTGRLSDHSWLRCACGIQWPRGDWACTRFPAPYGGARHQHAGPGRIRNGQTIEAATLGTECNLCCPYRDAARSSERRCVRGLSPRAQKGWWRSSARSHRWRASRVHLTRWTCTPIVAPHPARLLLSAPRWARAYRVGLETIRHHADKIMDRPRRWTNN